MSAAPCKLTVCVVTYNQEAYVRQCLQSLVDQQTDFAFQILVADDCSTDGTRAIIEQFAERYPARLVPVFHPKNIGAYKNFMYVHARARGQYIAHVDGDDYALPGKLQAQVDFLDAHPECNVVFHRMLIQNESRSVLAPDAIAVERFADGGIRRADLLRYITVGMHSSKMYRASVGGFAVPDFPVVDYFANVEHIGEGRACFVGAEPLGVYRNGIGIASTGDGTRRLIIEAWRYFADKYPGERRHICCAALMMVAAAAKNRRWGHCRLFAPTVLRTFHPGAVLDVIRHRNMYRMFSLPAEVRTP